jgi:hypothetical protein
MDPWLRSRWNLDTKVRIRLSSDSCPSLTRLLSVVEKTLWRKEGKTRHDLGRDGLLKLIWDWKDLYHKNITNQLKRAGGSMDWTREAFTMDENLSAAVRETFIQLHDEGSYPLSPATWQ